MPYTHSTLAQLETQLAQRLGDAGKVFWISAELQLLLKESLRLWNALTGYWKDRGQFVTAAGTAFYDITAKLKTPTAVVILDRTLKDQDQLELIQYHFLEKISRTSWTGTEMFTLDDVSKALQRRRDQFLDETGCIVNRTTTLLDPPPVGRHVLPDTVIDIRRAVWSDIPGNYNNLHRTSEMISTAYNTTWASDPNIPQQYALSAQPPLTMQLVPPPQDKGTLDYISTQTGATLDPATGVELGIPDDFAFAIRFGAMSDLLSREGQSKDPERARYCEMMYQLGVALIRQTPTILYAEINGSPVIPGSLTKVDQFTPGWQGLKRGTPKDLAVVAPNLVALNPVPDGIHSVLMDVVKPAPMPAASNYVEIGREHLEAILNMAQHLAAFKQGGADFRATMHLHKSFFDAATQYNQRLAMSPAAEVMKGFSTTDQRDRPSRRKASGVGAWAGEIQQ